VVFSIENIVEMGTLDETILVLMETDETRGKNKGEVDDEAATATKKQKSSDHLEDDFLAVILTELGTVVMPEYDKVMTLRNQRYSKLPQLEKDKIMAHQMQHAENKELDIKKVRKRLQEEKRIRKRMQRKEKKMLKCTSELY
jgi:hypothetical protein